METGLARAIIGGKYDDITPGHEYWLLLDERLSRLVKEGHIEDLIKLLRHRRTDFITEKTWDVIEYNLRLDTNSKKPRGRPRGTPEAEIFYWKYRELKLKKMSKTKAVAEMVKSSRYSKNTIEGYIGQFKGMDKFSYTLEEVIDNGKSAQKQANPDLTRKGKREVNFF